MASQIELLEKISDQLEELIEYQKRIPLVYSVNMGTMMDVSGAPAMMFQPEFAGQLQENIIRMMSDEAVKAAKTHSKEILQKAVNTANSNNYKKGIVKPMTEFKA